ncbi:MAG: CAP domain-containing protein, partial [Dokdonella sp.]|uniref:CAP domain-containing protein n=1 Tax=Dokdonella sp. TaxID=2291710 RepID=UPI0032662A39
ALNAVALPLQGTIMNILLLAALFFASVSTAHAAFLDCVFFDGVDGESATAPTAWKQHLQVSNCARKTVTPAAAPALPLLLWSASIAQTAQVHSDRCVWEHGDNAGLGQNISAVAPQSQNQTGAATLWVSEQQFYNYASNSCASGQQCGHYTQIVWRGTTQVGCAQTQCSSGSPFGAQFPNWTFIVCDYSPPGNYTGERPY